MGKFSLHVEKWRNCTACDASEGRTQIVFARGQLPCHVLFVGEAPGESEDSLGQPFVGPAGLLLDDIVTNAYYGVKGCKACMSDKTGFGLMRYNRRPEQSKQMAECPEGHTEEEYGVPLRLAYTNVLCCIPYDDGQKLAEPKPSQIKACRPRLAEFFDIARPMMVVAVGKVAYNALTGKVKGVPRLKRIESGEVSVVEITHPAAILRANFAQKELMIQRAVVALTTGAMDHLDVKHERV